MSDIVITKCLVIAEYAFASCIFIVASFCGFIPYSDEFLPNAAKAINPNDYTNAGITEIGILKAVAKFFEENPAPGCKCTPGSLTGISQISARKLYDAYYGGPLSESTFGVAVDDIIKQNNKVSFDHANQAAWHFNGEKIREGNYKMQILRDTAIQTLNSSSPNYDLAREAIGQFLYLLQSFYSNTNWVEMNGKKIYEPLVRGVRYIVGDGKFQDLLNLRTTNSLVFVVDTTASMGKDIAAVRQQTAEIVKETRNTSMSPFSYILVTFNDPANLTTLQKNRDPSELQRWLSDLRAHGGGDCPDYSLTGIQAAATAALPNSQIFVFTDSSPKDPEKINYIRRLATEKKLKIQFLVTGSCNRRRRSVGK